MGRNRSLSYRKESSALPSKNSDRPVRRVVPCEDLAASIGDGFHRSAAERFGRRYPGDLELLARSDLYSAPVMAVSSRRSDLAVSPAPAWAPPVAAIQRELALSCLLVMPSAAHQAARLLSGCRPVR